MQSLNLVLLSIQYNLLNWLHVAIVFSQLLKILVFPGTAFVKSTQKFMRQLVLTQA